MSIDLRKAALDAGLDGAIRSLVTDWWSLPLPSSVTSAADLLRWLQTAEIHQQLPQPQDRLLPEASDRCIGEQFVIAEENQMIWQAVIDPVRPNSLTFYEEKIAREDGSFSHAFVEVGSQPLATFLFDLLFVNASFDHAGVRYRSEVNPDADTRLAYLPSECGRGRVAGPGWFGNLGTHTHIKAAGPLPADAAQLGTGWEQLVTEWQDGDISSSPWSLPTGWAKSWRPVDDLR